MRVLLSLLVCFIFVILGPIDAFAQGNWEDDTAKPAAWTSGTVGIGTATPLHNLDVQGGLVTTIGLNQSIIQGMSVLGEGRIDFFPTPTSNYKASITVVDRFGDSSPDLFMQLLPAEASTSTRWSMFEGWKGAGLYVGTGGADRPIAFAINREEKMRLDAYGNLGIGTDNPQANLHVAGNMLVEGDLSSATIRELQDEIALLEGELRKQKRFIKKLVRIVLGKGGTAYSPELSIDDPFFDERKEDRLDLDDNGVDKNSGAYPNPFNPSTTFSYNLAEGNHVVLKVFNMAGREVATIVDEFQSAGTHAVEWNAEDNNGNALPSGSYLYKIVIGDFVQTKTIVLVK